MPPNFDSQQDDIANYGAIGAVIGHEIIHFFDDKGRNFDAQGNPPRLVDGSRRESLRHPWKVHRGSVHPGNSGAGSGVKQDGHLTQGEDTADNGGLRVALLAL